jgi:DNA polymerase-4
MSVAESLRLCPKLRVLPPDYPLYHKISNDIKEFLESEIPLIEQFSIDEFFGDITGWIKDEDAYMFAFYLQEEILKRFKIPVSIGLSRSKWIAKLATEDAKPQGIKLVEEDEINEYISNIPIGDFPGVGKGFLQRLSGHGIKTMGDVWGKEKLFLRWGKNGKQLYKRILGIDEEPIVLAKEKKSIGLGRTFDPIMDREEIKRRIVILSRHISFIALKDEHKPMSYFLKIRYKYGEKSKDHISSNRLFSEKLCKELMLELFDTIDTHPNREIIQLNLTLSNFLETKYTTLNILHYDTDTKSNALSHALHSLRDKFGIDIIKNAREMK